ncbi:polyphosphate kinase 2 [Marinicauda salina]|uniref:ADP/GDP-polyphosphate phosphotransferase n=1 Tax=Marinicauda salina TaxID=2135793 RepID=A0A2U2BVN9_9PROT|nr:polyphosphate kinase 2 [Marinicauda salina]PWE18057.1 polyphosphate kinase 2 [Marinicauda salina]
MNKRDYKQALRSLQIDLVALQRHMIAEGRRLLVIFEGRDAAGKDSTIKRITAHLSPRETRVVALGKPTERDRSSWYFQRWVEHLPAAGEFVLFNRSWYNRAGVEPVMGFCTEAEHAAFLRDVGDFEKLLVDDGLILFKYYLDISRTEQAARLEDRRTNPLKAWKRSPIDAVALDRFDDYSRARDRMLASTGDPVPWRIVRADDKRRARLAIMRDILASVPIPDLPEPIDPADPAVLRVWRAGESPEDFLAQ